MTPKEAGKKIEFILQMQAQSEANLGKLEADVAQVTANLSRCERNIDKLRQSQATLTSSGVNIADILRESVRISDERFTCLDERLTALAELQGVADARLARFDERMIELVKAQKSTDERLNALISVVERHITGPDHRPEAR